MVVFFAAVSVEVVLLLPYASDAGIGAVAVSWLWVDEMKGACRGCWVTRDGLESLE